MTAPTRGAIAPLELAAEMVDVPSEVPYTPKLLALTFMGQCDKDPADRYKTLLGREEGNILGEAAMATAVPEDFVTALVSHTLSKMPSAKIPVRLAQTRRFDKEDNMQTFQGLAVSDGLTVGPVHRPRCGGPAPHCVRPVPGACPVRSCHCAGKR